MTMAGIGVAIGVASWLSCEWLVSINVLSGDQAAAVLPR